MATKIVSPDIATSALDNTTLITRGGVVMSVRAVVPTDEPILQRFFERVSASDLHFRFLSHMRQVDQSRIRSMVHVDHERTNTFLAFDGAGDAIATAMLAADAGGGDAEVALSVRSDMKGRGVGWALLQYVIRYGQAKGFRSVESVESRANRETIDLEREAGFTFHPCEGDPAEVIAVKPLTAHPT